MTQEGAAERLEASRIRDFSALIEENTLLFILGPHRKEYIAHDMPLRFWMRRLSRPPGDGNGAGGETVSDLEVVCACLRVSEEELVDVAEVGMVETSKAAQVLVDHFLAQAKNVDMIRGMLKVPELTSALYRTTPKPSPSASALIPGTPSEASST